MAWEYGWPYYYSLFNILFSSYLVTDQKLIPEVSESIQIQIIPSPSDDLNSQLKEQVWSLEALNLFSYFLFNY